VWLPKFWEHALRSEDDFEDHFHYIHYNPVKHGLVASPREWPWSSFPRWVRAGVYPPDWASFDEGHTRKVDLGNMEDTVGE